MRTRVCSWAGVATAIVLAALAAGCVMDKAEKRPPVDASYITDTSGGESLNFLVTFVSYRTDDQALVERAWAETKDPAGDASALWQANGLRIGAAGRDKVKTIMAILRRAASVRFVSKQLVVAPKGVFEVDMVKRAPSEGLVYATSETTTYCDVTNLQVSLRLLPVNGPEGGHVSLTPVFYSGAPKTATPINGAAVVLPCEDRGIILAGPVKDPPDKHLGSEFYETLEDGQWGSLMLIEPKLSY